MEEFLGMLLSYLFGGGKLLTEYEGRTGEYWPEVVAVWTEHNKVCTEMIKGQYSPVWLEQATVG